MKKAMGIKDIQSRIPTEYFANVSRTVVLGGREDECVYREFGRIFKF